MRGVDGSVAPRSSLPLQLLLWLDGHVTLLLSGIVMALLVVKPFFLPYPRGRPEAEFILAACHPAVQSVRIWLGTAGNKQERPSLLAGFLWLTAWPALVTCFFWRLQLFGLRLECGAALLALVLTGLETVGGIAAALSCCDRVSDLVHVVAAPGRGRAVRVCEPPPARWLARSPCSPSSCESGPRRGAAADSRQAEWPGVCL
mmetsp:Transcript_77278/g.205112  ORF Transcript_77278/g.205112 Transcript_77278/m.205112 type:complete len:202 (+) Transcript_77278:122-727(+)